jgi:hypothetical protein
VRTTARLRQIMCRAIALNQPASVPRSSESPFSLDFVEHFGDRRRRAVGPKRDHDGRRKDRGNREKNQTGTGGCAHRPRRNERECNPGDGKDQTCVGRKHARADFSVRIPLAWLLSTRDRSPGTATPYLE